MLSLEEKLRWAAECAGAERVESGSNYVSFFFGEKLECRDGTHIDLDWKLARSDCERLSPHCMAEALRGMQDWNAWMKAGHPEDWEWPERFVQEYPLC